MQSCFRYYKTSRIIFLAKSKDLQLTTLNIKTSPQTHKALQTYHLQSISDFSN